MYCPFCGSRVTASHGFFGVCGRDITFLKDVANKVPEEMPTTSVHLSAQPSTSAATLEERHASIDRNSSLLQTAGCLQYPDGVDGKNTIIKDFMQWYIIYRNHFAIQRFKDGLEALDVIHALEQHATVFRAFMCSCVVELTSATLEEVFEVQHSSEKGSSRRHEETRVLGLWRDYLLETEEKRTGLLLGDILMFSTGLNTLPPSGIQPRPQLVFHQTSRFPIGRTCSNTLEIPMSSTYEHSPHRTPRSRVELDHSFFEGSQSVPGSVLLHMDCWSSPEQTGPSRVVGLGTHSQFHRTWM
ncbi:hypothetical protein F7725_007518 [Dissostichus mawsoni]|uniref:HECT domain-containing protein n=1 Tax=Dissostichus mawsoni TaxID=36200 RepID=A0A7J5Y4M1_DISMA|nr:hypothetical protein F7725_007518 [Dissostichus mawsoni]